MTRDFSDLKELSTADVSFALVVIHKKIRSQEQMRLVLRALVTQRNKNGFRGIETFLEERKLLTPAEIDRVLRTRWKHARKCSDCADLTYLMPRQRSSEVQCEHCRGPLINGRLDRNKLSAKKTGPSHRTTKNYFAAMDADSGVEVPALPTRREVEDNDATYQTEWNTGFNKTYDQYNASQNFGESEPGFARSVPGPTESEPGFDSVAIVPDNENADYDVVDEGVNSHNPTKEIDWAEELVGDQLGQYRILEKINEGGMSVIFLGKSEILGQKFVIKVLKKQIMNESRIQRLIREAQACMSLTHPNIVRVHTIEKSIMGLYYLVMEYVDGVDLEKTLEAEGPLPWKRASHIINEVAKGLAVSHAQNVLHRDIKPANILLPREGGVKIADFGLSKNNDSSMGITKDNVLVGTPLYMAPETGTVEQVDHRLDIYCLGLTFYILLHGYHPFEDLGLMAILKKQAHQEIPEPNLRSLKCPEGVVTILGQMLAFDITERYQSVYEIQHDFALLFSGRKVPPRRLGLWAKCLEIPEEKRTKSRRFSGLTSLFKLGKKDESTDSVEL
ncbi:MAG: serine/threonine-protein kinase [Planctomycetota bacterium]|nr:serine/threonine-protein kinase [Planctomycetota bacterium]